MSDWNAQATQRTVETVDFRCQSPEQVDVELTLASHTDPLAGYLELDREQARGLAISLLYATGDRDLADQLDARITGS